MKRIIDIDEEVRVAITRMGLLRISDEMQKKVDKAIQRGTPLLDNATNGEVAELIWGFKPRENTCIIPKTECNGNPAECDGCIFKEWWDAPYQKGGTNEK